MRRNLDIGSILETAFPSRGPTNMSNSSSPPGNSVFGIAPATLLETFIPGYGPIQKFLLFALGFDVTVLVSLGAALWLSARIGQALWKVLWGVISENYMAEISISSTDEIYTHLIQFLAQKPSIKSSRRLMAETPSKSAWELDTTEVENVEAKLSGGGVVKWLNFSNQEAKSQPRFTPAIGSHNFWHKGTYFQLRRKEVSLYESRGNSGIYRDKEIITLSSFGRSPEPIKKLIQHAKAEYLLGHSAKTVIKRPAPKDMRRYGGRQSWVKIAERPYRPMSTVVLDEKRKMDVLADINEYLDPKTAKWYSDHGIPYRRGYLLHGSPGTGKTSLTFALAGVFGLDIHVISLLDPTLTEDELSMLFAHLPVRCIVLLEDIDAAGLLRDESSEEQQAATASQTNGDDLNVVNLTRAIKKANQQTDAENKKGISLSGLLNIIDGVASHEGRVLVMTTNHPEKLDQALIRPGRVDHQVVFGNATRTQAKELFERMYTNDLGCDLSVGSTSLLLTPPPTPVKGTSAAKSQGIVSGIGGGTGGGLAGNELGSEELSGIAEQFANRIPDDMFSPAEIQGFLLKRKKDPRKALLEVDVWVEGTMEQKRKGMKVAKVQ